MKEIYFCDEITYENVVDFLENLPKNDFRLYFATIGGNVCASLHFGKKLNENKYLKEVICIGDVFSGGIIVLLLLKNKIKKAYPYITFGIHSIFYDFSLTGYTHRDDVYRMLNKGVNLENTILELYQKNNIDINEIKRGVTLYLTPEEALKYNIINDIIYLEEDGTD